MTTDTILCECYQKTDEIVNIELIHLRKPTSGNDRLSPSRKQKRIFFGFFVQFETCNLLGNTNARVRNRKRIINHDQWSADRYKVSMR